MKQHAIATILAVVVLILGGGFLFWQSNDDTYDTDNSTTVEAELYEQAPASAETSELVERENSETLTSDYLSDYTLIDEQYNTEVEVTIDEATNTRTITANALPNHDTGDFPNQGNPNTISEQARLYVYPFDPSFTGAMAQPKTIGVALNGVKFEPGTAETFTCGSGERYRVEAIQDSADLGLDFNNAHVQPTGEYHYHGASSMLADAFDNGEDLVHVGFAADGFLIYYSKSSAYASSYVLGDGERSGSNCQFSLPNQSVQYSSVKDGTVTSDYDYVEGAGDLDECNGTTIAGQYVYLVTEEFPFISRCLNGAVSSLR